ncbi:MAG TPA: hypothetical protein VFR87_15770 [Nocardioidaceae bacterium]|nr:hypothetical protein [Nocardioidaceae bacterium]
MASTVFLHVGAPLAPSTTLRDALAGHRRRLARVGVLYPPGHLGHDGGHREAVLDALSLTAEETVPTGSWDRLAEGVRDWRRGTAVLSNELLADASTSQVDRIVSSLGSAEVHVVYVAQDLGRALPRAWQQWVHSGGTVPWSSYASRVVNREAHRMGRVFWHSHDLAAVLGRWAGRVPADHVHVVTAAPGDTERTWARFAQTLGIDPQRFRLGAGPENGLAALAGTEVVRLLNAASGVDAEVDRRNLERLTGFALAVPGPGPRIPAELRDAAAAETERMVDAVRRHGWELVGDADDLRADDNAFAATPSDVRPGTEDVVRAQTEALRELCTRPQERRGPAGVRRRALRVLRGRVRP